MGVAFYVICCFSLVALNILSLPLIFVGLITVCLSAMFLCLRAAITVYSSLCLPCLGFSTLPRLVWLSPFPCEGSFQLLSIQIFSWVLSLSLFSLSRTLIMRMLVLLMLSQRSLKDCPHFFLFFFLILIHGSDFHHSIFQLTHPVFCLIYSDIYSIYCIFSFQLLYYSSVCFLVLLLLLLLSCLSRVRFCATLWTVAR